ncbi:MAG: hypothetical protein JSS02_24640, partial [Planctomycetes bacterium]|nr:hypothetical protein [Planctomycetota bacterium]
MSRLLLSLTALTLLATSAQAGPLGTYYITDVENYNDGISTLDAIRGDQYVQNASIYQYIEGPLAVVGGYVRTTGAV